MVPPKSKKRRQKEAQSIGANIRRLRQQRHFSQKQLAKILGVSYQQLQKYETGVNRFPADRLFVLHQALDMPLSAFFEGLDGEVLKGAGQPDWIRRLNTLKNPFLKRQIERVVGILLETEVA